MTIPMNVMPPFFEYAGRKNPFFQLIFLLFFMVIGCLLFSLLGGGLSSLIWRGTSYYNMGSDSWAHFFRFNQTVGMIGLWLVPSMFFSYAHDKKWFSYNLANQRCKEVLKNWVCLAAITILPVVGLIAYLNQLIQLPDFMSSIEEWMRAKDDEATEALMMITANKSVGNLILNLLVLGVFPAICEEFFFQGALQPLLTQWTKNKHIAIWLTAFIFSAIHFQFYGFIPRFLLGAYLGYLLIWSNSLWLPILAHMLHNVCSLLAEFVTGRNGIDMDDFTLTPQECAIAIPIWIIFALITALIIRKLWQNRITTNS